ncbi:MAG: N-acetyl-gamma-glutamyl-phosphate reductase [Alphaproteobacteria bacterium]|nr:N-acetyl-gamma-glutamyl-phosphate reductase [Alphaproteobacteria bacterium]
MTTKVFIDGESGTVGLLIRERLRQHPAFSLLTAPPGQNRDPAARRRFLNEADIAVLCLPEEATKEAVAMVENPSTRILDASPAHRTAAGWVYGLPELAPGQEEAITSAQRVANPGCFATAAILLLRPLIDAGLIPADYPVSISGVTGYTAGGRRMISRYESGDAPAHAVITNPDHRHLPEIHFHARLSRTPMGMFAVSSFPRGMVVQIPLALWMLPRPTTAQMLHQALADRYHGKGQVHVQGFGSLDQGKGADFDAAAMSGRDDLEIHVSREKTNERAVLIARLDNLGKGACGAAVQNLELMAGTRRRPA